MTVRRIFLVAFVTSALSCSYQSDPLKESSAFASAIRDRSTSPYFVKIQVADSQANRKYTNCVTTNLFQGALHKEKGLPYDDRGVSAIERFAISNQGQIFHFKSPSALQNMPSPPTATELAEAQALAANLSGVGLTNSAESGALRDYYVGHPRHHERMGAVACALIDRGLSPRLADITGSLYVEE